MPATRRPVTLVLRGMLLIARGRPEGLNCFRDTPQAFWFSLAPGLSLLFGGVIESLADGTGGVVGDVPGTLCVLLAPSVLSYEIARLWGREAFWNRFIVAFNWCQWLLPLIGLVALIGLTVVRSGAAISQDALRGLFICLALYALWLNWFLARHGLALSPWRAAGLVLMVNLGTVALVFGPTILTQWFAILTQRFE
jgi:hypothetical protein